MDRRLTPANDRAALESLRGVIAAPRYVPGDAARLAVPMADLCRTPGGARERQLLLGAAVTVIDRHMGWAFVQNGTDGYCGYLPGTALGEPRAPTHRVSAAATHLYAAARVQARDIANLSFGAEVTVTGSTETFAETPDGFIPAPHVRPLDNPFDDPVTVARLFLGTPYLWGGNSRAGIDCSGLVQTALLACGHACPADSDLQRDLGTGLPPGTRFRRNDLLFWEGHVALVADDAQIIHASGHVMATVLEKTDAAIARIDATGNPVIAHRRL